MATPERWSRAESLGWVEIIPHKVPLSVSRHRRLLPWWSPAGAQETGWVQWTEFFFLFGHVIFGVTLLNPGHRIFPKLFYNWHSLCLIFMFCCQIPVFRNVLFYFNFSRILERRNCPVVKQGNWHSKDDWMWLQPLPQTSSIFREVIKPLCLLESHQQDKEDLMLFPHLSLNLFLCLQGTKWGFSISWSFGGLLLKS